MKQNNCALMHASPSIVSIEEDAQPIEEAISTIVNNEDVEAQQRKAANSKMKSSSMQPYRTTYYTNHHPYGSMPYYYYSPAGSLEKPAPLMLISNPSHQPAVSQTSSSSHDHQIGTLSNGSPQNLPPRLRQMSSTDIDSNSVTATIATAATNGTSATSLGTHAPAPSVTTYSRRNRSILPRGYPHYYSQHPPPPLMATPPGVLYPYPPAIHPVGPVAYNIRSAEELEYFALQQQFLNLPPPLLWQTQTQPSLTSSGHPSFPQYAIAELPPPFMFTDPRAVQSTSFSLNPDAAEWVPSFQDEHSVSVENNILLDDEINFPPLNSAAPNIQTTNTDSKDCMKDRSDSCDSTGNKSTTNSADDQLLADNSIVESSSISTIEPTVTSTSSQDMKNTSINKPSLLSSSSSSTPTKVIPVKYSTVILKATDNQKSNKTSNTHNQQQRRQQSNNHNHLLNQAPSKDRPVKSAQQQRGVNISHNTHNGRRPPMNNDTRARPSTENNVHMKSQQPKQLQQQLSESVIDEWIEVKSKKTKKFDRTSNETTLDKFVVDEQIQPSITPPLSLSSTGENTTTSLTSEDDFDDKDHSDVGVIMDNDITNDYNQTIIDDIQRRLDHDERLLIIMRGCPGK
jgi:hypothetical protein